VLVHRCEHRVQQVLTERLGCIGDVHAEQGDRAPLLALEVEVDPPVDVVRGDGGQGSLRHGWRSSRRDRGQFPPVRAEKMEVVERAVKDPGPLLAGDLLRRSKI
jgi:hypothetical protein